MCKISSATASNSPIYTDTVSVVFNTAVELNNVGVEGIGIGLTANLATLNLNNGDFTLQTTAGDVSTGQINNEWVLYSPDKDMDVEMDLYGGGSDDNSSGEGGYSRIRFTMTQNTEYVVAGLTTTINTPYLYRKGTLMACVGEGGKGGTDQSQRGGAGGGVNIAGARGDGSNGGMGGIRVATGDLTLEGKFGSHYHGETPIIYPGDRADGSHAGGFTIACTKGIYWAQQGIAPCDDVGTGRFRLPGGEEVTNTTDSITRGYKSGYNIIQTAGAAKGLSNPGRGGNGARGGDGGQAANRTGGGGSGYTDGSVTVVDTRLGGSTGDAKVVLRLQT